MTVLAVLTGLALGFPAVWTADRILRKYPPLKASKYDIFVCAVVLAAFLGMTWKSGASVFGFICSAAVAFLLVCAALADFRARVIPNALTLPIAAVAVVSLIPEMSLNSYGMIFDHIWGALAGAVPLLAISQISRRLLKKEGFGMGDVKLCTVCGLFLGLNLNLAAMTFAFAIAGIWCAALIAMKKARTDSYIAFGPFIAAGVMLASLFGNHILSWYSGIIAA